MNSNELYPLTNDYMWYKMILESFRKQSDIKISEGYFLHQFKIRNDVFDSEEYFFSRCLENAEELKTAFQTLLENDFESSYFDNPIVEQVNKCEFVYGPDPRNESGFFKNNIVLITEDDFNCIITGLKNLLKSLPNKMSKVEKSKRSKAISFTLKNSNQKFEYLKDLKASLISKGLIHQETTLASFRRIFSGEEINERVIWTGNSSELSYFIKQLHNELQLVKNLKQDHWFVAVNCFEDSKGNSYKREKLKGLKTPSTREKIDAALKTLL